MSPMIERVARAIYDQHPLMKLLSPPIRVNWEDLREGDRVKFIECARAAIEAMCVPTEEMERAGEAHFSSLFEKGNLNTEDIWFAMINAALGKDAT